MDPRLNVMVQFEDKTSGPDMYNLAYRSCLKTDYSFGSLE